MIDKMDPEVAKKALDQFPDFASASKEMIAEFQNTIMKILDDTSEDQKSYYEASMKVIDIYNNMLDDENLSGDQKIQIAEYINEIHGKIGEKDSENKRFRIVIVALTGTFIIEGLRALASALGSGSDSGNSDDDF